MLHTLQDLVDDRRLTPAQAFLTDDSNAILRFALEALMSGQAAALVMLVEIRGGTSRSLGAQMVVRDDGQYCGFVSGGCVEAAAAHEALEALKLGQDRQVRYGEGSPWFDIVLPCGGGITLAVHVLTSVQPLLAVLNRLERRQPAGLRYSPQTQSLSCLPVPTCTGWHDGDFEIGFTPCVRLMILGQSIEAQVTADLAVAAGFDLHIVQSGTDNHALHIDADTAVILLCHDLFQEMPVLQATRKTSAFYIGALGSPRTHARRMKMLGESGWSQAEIERIKAPVGIFAKARDARTLALSILADVAAARLVQGAD